MTKGCLRLVPGRGCPTPLESIEVYVEYEKLETLLMGEGSFEGLLQICRENVTDGKIRIELSHPLGEYILRSRVGDDFPMDYTWGSRT